MAKIFLDTSRFIDLTQGRGDQGFAQQLDDHQVYISPLSTHVMFYTYHLSVPNFAANGTISQFDIIDLNKGIHDKALLGPTPDLEDNIQLHSAAEVDCEYFLTRDDKLLKMRFFGKTQILEEIR